MNLNLQIAAAFMVAASAALAQGARPAPGSQPPDTESIILAPASPSSPPATSAAADRPVSAVDAHIASGLPAYSAKPGSPAQDLRDVDKPRNQIPRLPVEMMQKYVVRESRIPVFKRYNLYTKAALVDLAFKEHPGLRFGNFFNLNAGAAYEMLMNEERLADRLDLVDTVLTMGAEGDASEAKAMQQAIIDESFLSAGKVRPVGIR